MTAEIPEKLYYKIGEVAKLTGVKPYVLRYWESEFRLVRPQKSRSGQRLYQRKDIEILLEIKRLLYDEKYTISGAKRRLKLMRAQADRQLSLGFAGETAPPVETEASVLTLSPPEGGAGDLSLEVLQRLTAEVEAIFELVREDESVQ